MFRPFFGTVTVICYDNRQSSSLLAEVSHDNVKSYSSHFCLIVRDLCLQGTGLSVVIANTVTDPRTDFKDFSRIFQGQITVFKDYDLPNKSVFFTPLWSLYWLKHIRESFTILTSSAIVHHIILYYFPQQNFAKWLGMTCNCIWGTEIAFEIKKKK